MCELHLPVFGHLGVLAFCEINPCQRSRPAELREGRDGP